MRVVNIYMDGFRTAGHLWAFVSYRLDPFSCVYAEAFNVRNVSSVSGII